MLVADVISGSRDLGHLQVASPEVRVGLLTTVCELLYLKNAVFIVSNK